MTQAYVSLRTLGYNVECTFPSVAARNAMPSCYHPALPMPMPHRTALLTHFRLITVKRLLAPIQRQAARRLARGPWTLPYLQRTCSHILVDLSLSAWSPDLHFPDRQLLHGGAKLWPAMDGPYGCIRILSDHPSLWAARSGLHQYFPSQVRGGRRGFQPKVVRPFPLLPPSPAPLRSAHRRSPVVTIWTDGSALHNGRDDCIAGSAWFSDIGAFEYAHITGVIPSNNITEVVAIVMALQAWSSHNLHIISDSKFALELVNSGLLAAERDGWPDLPALCYTNGASLHPLLQLLLSLLRQHNSSLEFSWVKGHSGDDGNWHADHYARLGAVTGDWEFDVSSVLVPPGWLDTAPVLNHQPLAHLTYLVVHDSVPPPLLSDWFRPFCEDWSSWIFRRFDVRLNITRHLHRLWSVNIPPGLKDLLWRVMSGSLPLGRSWHGASTMGKVCLCGSPMSAPHIWVGCSSYRLAPLFDLLHKKIRLLCPGPYRTLFPDEWGSPLWYPIFILQPLESHLPAPQESRRLLGDSCGHREWAIGSYLWFLWKARMKEIMEPDYSFVPTSCEAALHSTLDLPALQAHRLPLVRPLARLTPSPGPSPVPPSRRALIQHTIEAHSPLVFSPL